MLLRPLSALLCAVALASCGEPPAAAPQGEVDPLAPLEALPACPAAPAPLREGVKGLIVPRRTIIQKVEAQKPLVNVTAFVPMTPAQFEATYKAMTGIEILISENEIYEAELLVSDGSYRNFIKATATCSTGSQLVVVVAPEVDAEGLPVPQGAATATPGTSSP